MTDPDAAPARDTAIPPGPGSLLGAGVIAAVLAIDQATKWAAEQMLEMGVVVDILPILAFYRTTNTGIAFSFLRGADGTLTLIAVSIITLIVLVFWARSREGGKLAAVGFALIVGGAVGNIIDRIAYGHVIDFLLLHVGDRTLFVFNLADFSLTLGPIALIVAYLGRPARGAE